MKLLGLQPLEKMWMNRCNLSYEDPDDGSFVNLIDQFNSIFAYVKFPSFWMSLM